MKIAHVSTFPEIKCGIAFYASDLIQHLPEDKHQKYVLHYGANFTPDSTADADVAHPTAVRTLAKKISVSNCDVVSLQHEFGIWGGEFGENVLEFISHLTKPTISTLHTTFGCEEKNRFRFDILRELIEKSARVVVLSEASKWTLLRAIQCDPARIVVIPHGVPKIPYIAPPPWTNSHGMEERCKFISLGFFRPDKGFEAILVALSQLKKEGKNFSYIIAGESQKQFAPQEKYKRETQQLVVRLGLTSNVQILEHFLALAEQINLIQNCHAGIFAYQDPTHASSGTIPLVLAAGRPVICTPFEYARAKHGQIPEIVLADNFGAVALQKAILKFWETREGYLNATVSIHRLARGWHWNTAAARYLDEFRQAVDR